MRVPIDLVLSCRVDDVLLLPEIAEWCREGAEAAAAATSATDEGNAGRKGEPRGLRSCTLLMTPAANTNAQTPFPNVAMGTGDAEEATRLLGNLENAKVRRERLGANVVSAAVARMPKPCRVVVSGPAAFNDAARKLLEPLVDVMSQVTVLTA